MLNFLGLLKKEIARGGPSRKNLEEFINSIRKVIDFKETGIVKKQEMKIGGVYCILTYRENEDDDLKKKKYSKYRSYYNRKTIEEILKKNKISVKFITKKPKFPMKEISGFIIRCDASNGYEAYKTKNIIDYEEPIN